MSSLLTLGEAASGPVKLDLETLIETRLLLTATSGGGKSGTIFQLCEICVSHIQTIILDPEGEFSPLRAKFPFVLAGPEGETPASVKTAGLLAHRLLELGASAIIDLYEMPAGQRHEFVKVFLDSLIDAPKSLWPSMKGRGCLVIVDEAHIFAPESGAGKSVAIESMMALSTRGRKRGLCPVYATQRLAVLDKTLASMCQNSLVGRTSQIDEARAADSLHIAKSGTARLDFGKQIVQAKTGEFFAYGMAFHTQEPVFFKVARAVTMPAKKDRMSLQAPPAPEAIQKLLPKLADLPQEAEKKAKTEEELRADLRTANQRIRDLERNGPKDEETEKMLRDELAAANENLQKAIGSANADADRMDRVRELLRQAVDVLAAPSERLSETLARPIPPRRAATTFVAPLARPQREFTPPPDGDLSGPEQRILNALAWMESIGVPEPEQPAVAFLAGYTYGSGGYNNPRGRLNQRGLVRYIPGDRMTLTEDGKKSAQYPDIDPTNEALHEAILGKLPGPEGRILTVLLKCYPKAMDSTKLAEASGYTPGSGGFNNPRGRLKTLGLVEYPQPGMVVAKSLLFPEG